MALSLSERDRRYVWHPFTQMKTARPHIPIVRATGAHLYDAEGRRYLDGTASWWVNLHGHAHPKIIARIAEQAEQMEHVSFADFTHPPAIDLATKLIPLLPGDMSKIFYSDNGSTANEVALKMALQYWYLKNPQNPKTKVICFKNSYHGDTFGAMSASGKNIFNRPFWSYLFDVATIDPPLKGHESASLAQLHSLLNQEDAACFIFEPLVLGTGGMITYPPEGLDALLSLCRKRHVLTIADEVMTGFGRTGTLFACERLREKPDLICLSKGLTGGFLPLGATACTETIYQAFLGDSLLQAFLHGHSYTANPLACASALASLDLLLDETCKKQRKDIALSHKTFCRAYDTHPKLKRCESLGTLLILEYRTYNGSYFNSMRDKLYYFFLDRGILLRPLGHVLYVMPPYCMQREELQEIYEAIVFTLKGDL